MSRQPGDEPAASPFGEADLAAVFSTASPASTCAAVLTEARIVLPDISGPLDAELWGSDIVAALGSADGQARAIVPAAEQAGTAEALALLRVLAAIGPAAWRAEAAAAAGRLAAGGADEPWWAAAVGVPSVGECWRYGDAAGLQEAVTMSFSYGSRQHVVSVLVDHGEGGAVQDIWVGGSGDLLQRTQAMAAGDPRMTFEMISPQQARAKMERAFAAGECPRQPDETGNVASRRALLRARIDLLPARPVT